MSRVTQVHIETYVVQTKLASLLAEHEEHRVDDIRLAGTIRTNDRREALMEWADLTLASVRLEVLKYHLGNHEARLRAFRFGNHLRRRVLLHLGTQQKQ